MTITQNKNGENEKTKPRVKQKGENGEWKNNTGNGVLNKQERKKETKGKKEIERNDDGKWWT